MRKKYKIHLCFGKMGKEEIEENKMNRKSDVFIFKKKS
jgi:hypothetical protein